MTIIFPEDRQFQDSVWDELNPLICIHKHRKPPPFCASEFVAHLRSDSMGSVRIILRNCHSEGKIISGNRETNDCFTFVAA